MLWLWLSLALFALLQQSRLASTNDIETEQCMIAEHGDLNFLYNRSISQLYPNDINVAESFKTDQNTTFSYANKNNQACNNYIRNSKIVLHIVEGAICNGEFRPLSAPLIQILEHPVSFLECTKEKVISAGMTPITDVWEGLLVAASDYNVSKLAAFPMLLSRINNHIALHQHVSTPYYYSESCFLIAMASPGTCAVQVSYVKIPSLRFIGYALIVYTPEKDSRCCGLFRPDGHSANAIVLSNSSQNFSLTLRLLVTDHFLREQSLSFHAQALAYSNIRVVVVDAHLLHFLKNETEKQLGLLSSKKADNLAANVLSFLEAMFEYGILVVFATFQPNFHPMVNNPSYVVIDGATYLSSPGLPISSELFEIATKFITDACLVQTIVRQGQNIKKWYGAVTQVKEIQKLVPLVSGVVDGLASGAEDLWTEDSRKKSFYVLDFLEENWKHMTSFHFSPAIKRKNNLLQQEILLILQSQLLKKHMQIITKLCPLCNIYSSFNSLDFNQFHFAQ